MQFKDLKVGQRIQASVGLSKDKGTITRIDTAGLVYINWDLSDTGRNKWRSTCSLPETFSYWILIEEGTTEERVANRIKNLWNNSNWVKKNPSQAY